MGRFRANGLRVPARASRWVPGPAGPYGIRSTEHEGWWWTTSSATLPRKSREARPCNASPSSDQVGADLPGATQDHLGDVGLGAPGDLDDLSGGLHSGGGEGGDGLVAQLQFAGIDVGAVGHAQSLTEGLPGRRSAVGRHATDARSAGECWRDPLPRRGCGFRCWSGRWRRVDAGTWCSSFSFGAAMTRKGGVGSASLGWWGRSGRWGQRSGPGIRIAVLVDR